MGKHVLVANRRNGNQADVTLTRNTTLSARKGSLSFTLTLSFGFTLSSFAKFVIVFLCKMPHHYPVTIQNTIAEKP